MSSKTETDNPIDKVRQDLELIVQTGLLLAKSDNLEQLVQATTDAGLRLSGAELGAFFYNVIDQTGESYLLFALAGADSAQFSTFPMPRNTAVFAPTFEGTEIIRSGDITKDPRYGKNPPFHGMPKGHLPVCSYLAVPVKAQSGAVLGGLFYGHSEPDVFEQESQDFVATIAAQAAVAIENFRLREQLTWQIEALKDAELKQRSTSKYMGELAAIVHSSDDAILSKDLNGIITSWNEAAARLFRYTREEIVGQSILRLIPRELHSEETVILGKIRAGERIEHFETIRVKKNGEKFDVSLTISPVKDDTGTIVGASKILRDISQRKMVEASLIQAEKLAATGRMAATIAHEINNPLEAVMNLVFLARHSAAADSKINQYLLTAENELERVSQIARQTLGYYRDTGSPVKLYVHELVDNVLKVYRSKALAAEIGIDARFEDNEPIVASKGEILQVLSNLVSNALDAMPSGGNLNVLTQRILREDESGIEIIVRDTGGGIPVENMGRIFEPFFTTKGHVGTGLGLWVAKQLIEKRGGHLSIFSSTETVNSGTTANIFIPFSLPPSNSSDGE